jgi:U4/U6 small nuclear ribonucleoprotein PRP4
MDHSTVKSSELNAAVAGTHHVASTIEVLELTAASLRDRATHQTMLLDMEAKNRAFQVDVPTLPKDVRIALRNLGLPVRLFGENLANVRDRLRMELARRMILQKRGVGFVGDGDDLDAVRSSNLQQPPKRSATASSAMVDDENVTKYSGAPKELITARERISVYSLHRAKYRLDKERSYRLQWQRKRARQNRRLLGEEEEEADEDDDKEKADGSSSSFAEVEALDQACLESYKQLRNIGLEGSQYGDTRPLSSIATSLHPVAGYPLVATGGWSGTIQLWDGSSPELSLLGRRGMAHEDRIMSIAVRPPYQSSSSYPKQIDGSHNDTALLATASIDLTAKLWKVQRKSEGMVMDEDEDVPSKTIQPSTTTSDEDKEVLSIQQMAHLKGHAARLCSVAFHPQGDYVATTSFDHTWRLWDVATGGQILLQDGHWKEVYGIGFHPDGSLCASTDYGGVVQVWDLRTGKSACHFLGHAKRVLCSEFAPNGFQLATAGDDGSIKIWDLRQRKQFASVPAHSNLVTQLKFDNSGLYKGKKNGSSSSGSGGGGEYLASSSFDGTAKVWSTRDWKMLATMRGHHGKVMGVDILQDSFVTSGFDKTLKLWR